MVSEYFTKNKMWKKQLITLVLINNRLTEIIN